MRRPDFCNLSDTIGQIVKGRMHQHMQFVKILNLWDEVVGAQISKNAKAVKFYNNTLYVSAVNSTWSSELYFLKERIISKYKDLLPNIQIDEIKFKVTRPESLLPPPPKKVKKDYSKYNVSLSEAEVKRIEKNTENIKDDELKERVFNLFNAMARREKVLKKAGFKTCIKCGSLYKEQKNLNRNFCDVCTLTMKENKRNNQ